MIVANPQPQATSVGGEPGVKFCAGDAQRRNPATRWGITTATGRFPPPPRARPAMLKAQPIQVSAALFFWAVQRGEPGASGTF